MDDRAIIDEFHRIYGERTLGGRLLHEHTLWMGMNLIKTPLDLWTYQEIIYKHKPDFIIECGAGWGVSGLFLAQMCELMNHGQVISIDIIEHKHPNFERPKHKLNTFLLGSSVDIEIVDKVKSETLGKTVMVILDSDHTATHVLRELNIYKDIVTVGQYLIVEDTDINGHPTLPGWGSGPHEAVEKFLKTNKNFSVDKYMEKFLLTTNPDGYLLKHG